MRRWVWFMAGAFLAACGGSSSPTATVAPAAPTLPPTVTPGGIVQTATALAASQPTIALTVAPAATVAATRGATTPAAPQATVNATRPGASATPPRTAVAATASATTPAAVGGALFRDMQGRYSFVPDATWKNMKLPGSEVRFTSEDATNSFTVTAEKAAAGVSLDQYVDQDIESLKRLPTPYEPAARGRQTTTLGGEPARELNYFRTGSADIRFTNVRTYAIKGGMVYVVTAMSMVVPTRQAQTQAASDAFQSQAVAVVKSWKFL